MSLLRYSDWLQRLSLISNWLTQFLISDWLNALISKKITRKIFIETFQNDLWPSVTAAGYIILYDVDKESSFKSAVEILTKLRHRDHCKLLEPMILVGNKTTDIRRRVLKESMFNGLL